MKYECSICGGGGPIYSPNDLCTSCYCIDNFNRRTDNKVFQCHFCGLFDSSTNWAKDTLLNGHCFSCSFWLRQYEEGRSIVHQDNNGYRWHFIAGPDNVAQRDNGCGGALFKFEMLDGTTIITNNLWGQGNIPKRFYHLFPVNVKSRKES